MTHPSFILYLLQLWNQRFFNFNPLIIITLKRHSSMVKTSIFLLQDSNVVFFKEKNGKRQHFHINVWEHR